MKYFKAGKSKSSDRAESSSRVGRSEPSEGTKSERSDRAAAAAAARNGKAEKKLLKELAKKNEEVARQREQLGKLHNEVSRIVEIQAAQKKQLRSIEQEHKAEVRNLQKQVDEERQVKHAIEMELTTLMDRCNELVHENKLNELGAASIEHEVDDEEEEDHEPCCHEGPSASYGSTEEPRSLYISNESSSGGGSTHDRTPPDELNKLKGHLDTLDISIREEVPFADDEEVDRRKLEEYEAKTSKACSHVKKDLGRLKKWVGWKWRWAAEALRSDIMSKRLEGGDSSDHQQLQQQQHSNQAKKASKCRGCGRVTCVCSTDSQNGTESGMVPAVMTAWRAYARAIRLEKKALSMITSLEKMVSALPWWIRRVGQRRLLERCFFRWEMAALRRTKSPAQDASADALNRKCSACKHDVESKLVKKKEADTQKKQAETATNGKPRKAWGSSSAKGEYVAWENHVRNKKNDCTRFSGVKKLQSLQASIQKEVRELESQLTGHMQELKEDKNQNIVPKGPIWKGSCSSTWEICNNLVQSLVDARKQLGSADGKLKENVRLCKKYRGGQEQLLDIPGGFNQQKMNSARNNNTSAATKGAALKNPSLTPRQQKQQQQQQVVNLKAGEQQQPHTVVEVPDACNLTLDPGASVNVSCPDGKGGAGDRGGWDNYGGRICTAAQYADYLREEIKKLRQWQIEHESEIRKELGAAVGSKSGNFAAGEVHPELEVVW